MKRLTAGLLTFVISFSVISCSDAQTEKVQTAADSNTTEQQSQSDMEKPTVPEYRFPDINYNGQSFNFLSRIEPSKAWDVLDAFTEGETGEILNDAIYQRNLLLYEKYGVEITQFQSYDTTSELKTAVLADDNVYDAVLTNSVNSFSSASQGYLTDMKTLPYADFSKPWWDSETNSTLELYGKQFYAISDMNIMAWDATWITMINKSVIADLTLDINDIYNIVRDGKWTIDKYHEISELYIKDVNQNGKTDAEDCYGTVMQGHGADGFVIGCGVQYIDKDADGKIVLVPLSDRAASVFDAVASIVNNKSAFNSHDSTQNNKYAEDTEYGQHIFSENRAVFFTETLQCVRRLREMEADFGVIPMPKYDENQSTYISMLHWWATSVISVPLNAPDPEKSSAVLEYMSYLSSDIVKNAYFDVAVNGKCLRDEESIEMMNYIMEKRVIDLSYILFPTISDTIRSMLYKSDNQYASAYAKKERMLEKIIDKQFVNIR